MHVFGPSLIISEPPLNREAWTIHDPQVHSTLTELHDGEWNHLLTSCLKPIHPALPQAQTDSASLAISSVRVITIVCAGMGSHPLPQKDQIVISNPGTHAHYGLSSARNDRHPLHARSSDPISNGFATMMHDNHMTFAWQQLFWQLNLDCHIIDKQNMHVTDHFPTLEAHLHGPEPGALLGMLLLMVGIILPKDLLAQWLLGSQAALRQPAQPFHKVLIKIEGLSAGSYSAIVVYRFLLYLRQAMACESYIQIEAVAGAISLPPHWLDGQYPLKTLSIVHVAQDQLCIWDPSTGEMDDLTKDGITWTIITR